MDMIAVYIISGLLIIWSVWVGIRYIGQYRFTSTRTSKQIFNKQEAVKERREEFGVSNQGTSMEDAPIHVVPYNDLGING